MAITFGILATEREHEYVGSFFNGWSRTYQRTYLTKGTTITDTEITVRAAAVTYFGGPGTIFRDGQPGGTDPFSFMQSVKVKARGEDGLDWLVTLTYGPYDPTQRPENPLDQPPNIDGDWVQFDRVVDLDTSGNAIVNSAGDPFDPGETKNDTRPVLRVQLNQATFSLALSYANRDAVNNGTWMGAAHGIVKADPVRYQRLWHPICGWYFSCQYAFQFNPDGWHKKPLDCGFKQIVSGKLVNIVDQTGAPITSPAKLNGSGVVAAAGATPIYLDFQIYPEVDFSSVFNLDSILSGIFA